MRLKRVFDDLTAKGDLVVRLSPTSLPALRVLESQDLSFDIPGEVSAGNNRYTSYSAIMALDGIRTIATRYPVAFLLEVCPLHAALIQERATPDGWLCLGDETTLEKQGDHWVFQNEPETVFGGNFNPWLVTFSSRYLEEVAAVQEEYYFGKPLRLSTTWVLPVHRRPSWRRERIRNAFQAATTMTRKQWNSFLSVRDGFHFVSFEHPEGKSYTMEVRDDGEEIVIVDKTTDDWARWGAEHNLAGEATATRKDGLGDRAASDE